MVVNLFFSTLTKITISLTTLLMLASCYQSPPQSNNAISEYTALLANMEAIRKDVNELRTDIAVLRKEINTRQQPSPSAAAVPAAQPAPALVVSELLLDEDDPVLGSDDAKLAIVEFTDYECPFCGKFNDQTLSRLVTDYVDSGKVQLITRDLPLNFHANAIDAALVANCAGEQGAYEAVRAGIFANQQSLGAPLYKQLATENELDVAAMEACAKDASKTEEIQKDASYAASLGITGTPSFFIGRIEGDKLIDVKGLVGALPYESFSVILEEML